MDISLFIGSGTLKKFRVPPPHPGTGARGYSEPPPSKRDASQQDMKHDLHFLIFIKSYNENNIISMIDQFRVVGKTNFLQFQSVHLRHSYIKQHRPQDGALRDACKEIMDNMILFAIITYRAVYKKILYKSDRRFVNPTFTKRIDNRRPF